MIKLFDPAINSKEKKAIVKVLQGKFWASGSGSGLVRTTYGIIPAIEAYGNSTSTHDNQLIQVYFGFY